jgi:hypothetical protein
MASNSSDVEHQGSLVIGDAPNENSPLLRVESGNSKTSVSSSTSKLIATEEAADVEVSEMRQKDSAAAVISLLLVGMYLFVSSPLCSLPMTSTRRLHLECRWFIGNRHSANDLVAFLTARICKLAAHELCAISGCCTACAREDE